MATEKPFPFYDLEPNEFHRLVLFLVQRQTDRFTSVQDYGSGGNDQGRDIVAIERRPNGTNLKTVIQVKRTQELSKRDISLEIAKIASLPDGARPDLYIIATAATPNATIRDHLESECAKIGIVHCEVWGRIEMSGLLVAQRDIADFFFSPPTDVSHESSFERCQDDILDRGCIFIIGEGKTGQSALRHRQGLSDVLKTFIEYGIASGIIDLGDGKDVVEAWRDAGLPLDVHWQGEQVFQMPFAYIAGRNREGDSTARISGSEIVAATRFLGQFGNEAHPTVVFVNASENDYDVAAPLLARIPDAVPLHLIGSATPPMTIPGTARLLKGQFTAILKRIVPDKEPSKLRKMGRCVPVDFSGAPSIERIVRSEPFHPADVQIACQQTAEINEILRQLDRDRHYWINGSSGDGKSALALQIAHQNFKRGMRVFRVQCRSIANSNVSIYDLFELVNDMSSIAYATTIIFDDFHLLTEKCTDFIKGPFPDNIRLIFTRNTTAYHGIPKIRQNLGAAATFGPGIQDVHSDERWPSFRAALCQWVSDHAKEIGEIVGKNADDLGRGLETSTSPWHFFYILRGGQSAVALELEQALAAGLSHVAWCLIAAVRFMTDNPCRYYDLLELCREHRLPMAKMPEADIGQWLSNSLEWLSVNRMIIVDQSGFYPRHQLEAASVMWFIQSNRWEASEVLHDIAVSFVQQFLTKPILSEAEIATLMHGEKTSVKHIISTSLNPIVEKFSMIDLSVQPSKKLEAVYGAIWSPLVTAIEGMDIHHMYWLFNWMPIFSDGGLHFPPTHFIKTPKALSITCVCDVVDLSVAAKGIMSFGHLDALNLTYKRLTYATKQIQDSQKELAEFKELVMRSELTADQKEVIIDHEIKSHALLINQMIPKYLAVHHPREEIKISMQRVARSSLEMIKSGNADKARRHALAHSVSLLDKRRRNSVGFSRAIDIQCAADFSEQHPAEIPLMLFSLWLISPASALNFVNSIDKNIMNKAARSIVRRIDKNINSYSLFYSEVDTTTAFMFYSWLSSVNPDFSTWYSSKIAADESLSRFIDDLNTVSIQLEQYDTSAIDAYLPDGSMEE